MAGKILTALSKIIAFIFAVLFVLVTVAVLLLFNVERYLLNSEVYKQALVKENIYERFPTLVADQITHQITAAGPGVENGGAGSGSGGLPEQIKHLTRDDYEAILRDLLPAPWLQTQTESALDQTFAFIASEAPTATIKISLVEVKARIGGEAGVNAALRVIRSWPPCTEAQLMSWATVSNNAQLSDLPTCRPPEEAITILTPKLMETLSQQAAKLPDAADLTQVFKGKGAGESGSASPSNSGNTFPNGRTFLRLARPLIRWSPLLSIFLLLLVTVFGVRSFRGWLRWWGIPFLLAGVILGLPAVVALLVMNPVISNFMADKIPAVITPDLFQAGMDLGRDILRLPLRQIAIESGVMGLAGLVMFAVSLLGLPQPRRRASDR